MGYYGDWELMVGVLFKNEAGYTESLTGQRQWLKEKRSTIRGYEDTKEEEE